MKGRSFLLAGLVAILPAVGSLFAQGPIPVPRKAYFHLEGTVNKDQPISVEMVKAGDSVYCDYQYSGPLAGRGTAVTEPAVVPVFCGKMAGTGGSYVFHEPFASGGLKIRGTWSASGGFTGTWEDPGKEKSQYEWKEKYPVGTAQFNVAYIKESAPLVKKADSPKATVEMVILTPAESVNPILSDTLKHLLIEKYTGKPYKGEDPQAALNEVKNVFIQNYRNNNEALYHQIPDAGSLNWEMLKFMHILHNRDYVLCFYILEYAFTGGAHGLESTDFYVINLMTGKKLELSDLFREGSDSTLTVLLTGKVKQAYCRNHEAKLTDAGFFTDEVKPCGNFFVTDNGIGFHYNQYDLAPHSFGAIEAFLDFSEIRGLLKPASEIPVKLGK
ncbi:MAG TPA: RsiV family protein [Bacteroidales bacterium]|nr:RsiV family protein [Bacteroidales bacterium]